MKSQLLKHAADISALGKKYKDAALEEIADKIAVIATQLPEDSVTSSETNNDEEDDDGGIEVPKKPPPP